MVYAGRRILMDINNAVHLLFRGKIADHSAGNARLAVLDYVENARKRRENRKQGMIQYMKRIHFRNYIRRVFMKFGRNTSLSLDAVAVINDMIWDLFNQIATEAKNLKVYAGRRTLTVSDIINAVHLLFRGRIAVHAVTNARLAVLRYVKTPEEEENS